MKLVDSKQRNTIRTALDRTLVVEAAAGTGKTTELVERMVAVIRAGKTTIGRIAGVTFTEKAAGELKLRLRNGLEKARTAEKDAGSRNHLEQALAHLEEARLSTIHSFCADLLRERPVEAVIDPEFELLTEEEADRLYREAFRGWFERSLENLPQGTRRFLRRKTKKGPTESLILAGLQLAEWRDFPTHWGRPEYDRVASIDSIVVMFDRLADLTSDPADPDSNLFRDTGLARNLSESIRTAERARQRDYDGIEATLALIATSSTRQYKAFREPRRGRQKYKEKVKREDILALHNELLAAINVFASKAGADVAALLQIELGETVARYQLLKQRAGSLDFLDLLIRTRDLLVKCRAVRAHFQERFTHIFVDEFQDTDPLQAEILILLSSADPAASNWRAVKPVPGKMFIVGDPKQAIYRFRRADVGTYEEVKKLLLGAGAELLELSTSFRSLPSIQSMINRAFAPYMDGSAYHLQAAYVPLCPFRKEYPDQPSIVSLSVPRPYKQQFSMEAVQASLPDAIGAFIAWLVEKSNWTVPRPRKPDERIPLEPSHICLLFRKFVSGDEDLARPYVRALEARNLPHLLVGGRSFHNREEVQTICTALAAIEWPEDELSVFATLKGSLFAIPDDVLLEYRKKVGRFHPFRIPGDELAGELQHVVKGLHILQKMHRNRNYRPVVETLEMLLRETRAHLGFALRPSGEQVLANVLQVAELARKYEAEGGLSFRGFVEQLRDGKDSAQTGEAPLFEEGSEGVRMMSVHKAKGLEFPVVILADITSKVCFPYPGRHIDATTSLCAISLAGCTPMDLDEHSDLELARDRAEGVRVAYVAATRARELLVVPTIGDDPRQTWESVENWWVRPLYDAVYPEPDRRRKPGKAPACPDFAKDTVLSRPPDLEFDEDDTVWTGAHGFGEKGKGNYEVVWWDPKKLTLDVPQSFGIRQEELLAEPKDPGVLARDLERYRNWQQRREKTRQQALKPGVAFCTATTRARMDPDVPVRDIDVIELVRDPLRPAGPRFGALVHATLSAVPLEADVQEIEKVTSVYARVLGSDDREKVAAVPVVTAVLGHSVLLRARAAARAGHCRRETPVTLTLGDGTLVEGILDLAFKEYGAWTVVDFKTDLDIGGELGHYRRQVDLYAQAIERATGTVCSAVLMSV